MSAIAFGSTAPPADASPRNGDIPVTVVVPVKNEEHNLGRCLGALSRFAEVIVVDSGSVDKTREIALAAGAKLIDFHWDGYYPKKRNWVLINHALANGWVLFLDADEIVDEPFCDEVVEAVASGRHDGYWLSYTNYFLGRRLRFGIPQRKLALFKIGAGLYERIEEDTWSNLDMEIHEHPVIEGSVGEIRAPIEHNDFRGIEKFLDRHRDYARWEARRYLSLTVEAQQAAPHLTNRQRFKYRHLDRWWYPWFYFLFTYVLKRGFLDGRAGFSYAFYKAWYFQTIRLLISELRAKSARK